MGYIKLYRELLDWEWSDEPNTLALWIHLLLLANWKDGERKGEDVKRGQVFTSISKLSATTGLSPKQVRICLDRLERSDQITKVGSNKWTKITICNYESYQCQSDEEQEVVIEQEPTIDEVDATEVKKPSVELKASIDRLYAIYPSKCPVSGRATAKGSKDKRKLESLLRAGHSEEELASIITRYVQDCIRDNSYIKNFQTLLNNLPDYGDGELWTERKEEPQEPIVYYQSLEELEAARKAKKNR